MVCVGVFYVEVADFDRLAVRISVFSSKPSISPRVGQLLHTTRFSDFESFFVEYSARYAPLF